jgi:hypothetical protein
MLNFDDRDELDDVDQVESLKDLSELVTQGNTFGKLDFYTFAKHFSKSGPFSFNKLDDKGRAALHNTIMNKDYTIFELLMECS